MTTLPIFATLVPLEKISIYTPLGIRFWDVANDTAVVDGLEVAARPAGRPTLRRNAFQTASGIYAFHNLPGLRAIEVTDPELPAGIHPRPTSPPQSFRMIIEVNDRLGRFIPINFQVELPYSGIYPTRPAGSPPGSALPGFFLFSAPSRSISPNLAVVRAQIVERVGPEKIRPAGHAVLEVMAPGQPTWIGIADERGSVLVTFPYPRFAIQVAPLSPPAGPSETRVQAWDIAVRARYLPAGQTKPDTVASLPDLGAILTQPTANLWPGPAGPGQANLNARLLFGQPLVLQTGGRSDLWIET